MKLNYQSILYFSELILLFDFFNSVYIYAPETLQNRVCGLCGNFNDDMNDEFYSVNGAKLDNYADFVNSWLDPFVPRDIKPIEPVYAHPCSLLSHEKVSFLWRN